MQKLSAWVSGCSKILSVVVEAAHNSQMATAVVEAEQTSLGLGDFVQIFLGYDNNPSLVFSGYVKSISIKEPERYYTINLSDAMTRLAEYYIVSANPLAPMRRKNIDAALLVRDVVNEAGIYDFDYELTNFILGIYNPIEINLKTAYEVASSIANLIAWHVWADQGGGINFFRRFPWPGDSEQPVKTINLDNIGIAVSRLVSDADLRNRVVVYGANGIFAEAKVPSPYLPPGYYKTAVVSSPYIDSQSMATQSANYNLELYNRITEQLDVIIPGDPSLFPRTTIHVIYSPLGINSNWYIFSREHSFSKGGFLTTLSLRRRIV